MTNIKDRILKAILILILIFYKDRILKGKRNWMTYRNYKAISWIFQRGETYNQKGPEYTQKDEIEKPKTKNNNLFNKAAV